MITRFQCVLFSILAPLLVACDTVTDTYPTLADARKAGVFDRSWLPDILPPSAANIRTSNDLDVNASEGSFSILAADVPVLQKRLQPGYPAKGPLRNWREMMERKRRQSDWVAQYSDGQSVWVFNCRAGRSSCEYLMWLKRDGATSS